MYYFSTRDLYRYGHDATANFMVIGFITILFAVVLYSASNHIELLVSAIYKTEESDKENIDESDDGKTK